LLVGLNNDHGFSSIFGVSTLYSYVVIDIEKFDGRIDFGLWKVQVNDVLIQLRLHKALKCRMSVHLKRNCPGGAVSIKDSEASANNVSLVFER
jgi:hypothetical protein